MTLAHEPDHRLYLEWKRWVKKLTPSEIANHMPDLSEAGVRKLLRAEPTRLNDRTRKALVRYVEWAAQGGSTGHHSSEWEEADRPHRVLEIDKTVRVVREAMGKPVIPTSPGAKSPSLGDSTRVWVQEFLLRLIKAGCSDDETDDARRLLTRSDVIDYAHGGTTGFGQLTESEVLDLVKGIARTAIVPRLQTLGKKVDASFAD